jgi:hypothetical protein
MGRTTAVVLAYVNAAGCAANAAAYATTHHPGSLAVCVFAWFSSLIVSREIR